MAPPSNPPATPPPLPSLPPRPQDSHKGTFGRLLILGGSPNMIGAPAFAGTAALRCGSGLVRVAAPQEILAAILSISPQLTGLGLSNSGSMAPMLEAADNADALVIGPGLGQSPQAKSRVLALVRLPKPMVLDADALNVLAAQKKWPAFFKAQAVLTPHPGEMARLAALLGRRSVPSDPAGRIAIATAAAKAWGQVVLLKGHRTVITDGQRVYINQTGDSTLAKAGSGDVLSGILGCFLGQKMEPFAAACLAAYLHGRAGELAGQRIGCRCALAHDWLDALPAAIRELGG